MPQEIVRDGQDGEAGCTDCPRRCGAHRALGDLGSCRTDLDLHVASICRHPGEEPAISGREARKAVAIILAIYESARRGAPVEV